MERVKQELFREPQGGGVYWVLLGLGGVLTTIALAAFAASLFRGEVDIAWLNGIVSSLVLTFWGMSELVPGNQRWTAAVLRICMIVSSVSAIGLLILTLQ